MEIVANLGFARILTLEANHSPADGAQSPTVSQRREVRDWQTARQIPADLRWPNGVVGRSTSSTLSVSNQPLSI